MKTYKLINKTDYIQLVKIIRTFKETDILGKNTVKELVEKYPDDWLFLNNDKSLYRLHIIENKKYIHLYYVNDLICIFLIDKQEFAENYLLYLQRNEE